MKKLLTILLLISLFVPALVSAQVTDDTGGSALRQLNVGAGFEEGAEVTPAHPGEIVVGVIKVILSILGMLFTVLVVYGGYLYLTSRGEEEQVTKAQNTIKSAIIGLIIIVLAYAITSFVGNSLVSAIR